MNASAGGSATGGASVATVPVRMPQALRRRTKAGAKQQEISESEFLRRVIILGTNEYEREFAPDRNPTDGLAIALDEVARRVCEQFGAQRLAAWQVVMSWVISRSTVDYDKLTGENLAEATDA